MSDFQSAAFDPNDSASADAGIYGIPTTAEGSRLWLLPVPWEVTTSYGAGASDGPELIRAASEQVDLFDLETGKAYEAGYHLLPFPAELKELNDRMKMKAQRVVELRSGRPPAAGAEADELHRLTAEINAACAHMTDWVAAQVRAARAAGKLVGLIGGDHSTPLGAIQVLSEELKGDFAVLHIDAHADLRRSYQGMEQSHASIMDNVMALPTPPRQLVQVGIRDFCEEEFERSRSHPGIHTYFDTHLKTRLMCGESWDQICSEIIGRLPQRVYISFDIDGLDPHFCPHTGTPVPGGLSTDQVFHLFARLARSGRRIVGFDLNEVSSGGEDPAVAEWDGNVGARVLYKLCGWTVLTND